MNARRLAAIICLAASCSAADKTLRVIMVDPAHSHATALYHTMLPGLSNEVHIYAPLGPELLAHIGSVGKYNARPVNPTHWNLQVYAGPDFLEKMLREPPGNMVMLSGRNQRKMEFIDAGIRAGQNVLADKPWIIEPEELPRLEAALESADRKGLIAYDAMTQRFDVAYQLQRELVNDRDLFGSPLPGSDDDPAVIMESKHAFLKMGHGGVVNLRPAWFFDLQQQGDGMADVGTHMVDLTQWTLVPDQPIAYRRDVRVVRADRHFGVLTLPEFQRVTGDKDWPPYLRSRLREGRLPLFADGTVVFTLKGITARLTVKWEYEAKEDEGDSMFALYRGSRCGIRVRAGKEEHYRPEVDVIVADPEQRRAIQQALQVRLRLLESRYPGITLSSRGKNEIRVVIPQSLRNANGDSFAQLTSRFLDYVRTPGKLPAWEKSHMISKYYITTRAAALARQGSAQ